METKPKSTSIKKTEKGNPATAGDKKEGSLKEQPNTTTKKAATADPTPVSHEDSKPTAPEPQAPPSTSENKTNGEENDVSNASEEGSGCEGLKPLLVAAGVAVAAVAIIVGFVFLARRK